MKRNEEILKLAEEIMIDITDSRIPLHNILLKASRLAVLLDIPKAVESFKEWAKSAEQNQFVVDTFKSNIESTRDNNPYGNIRERNEIRDGTNKLVELLASYRTETYNFALGVYTKWQFGNIAENIFEKKRKKTEPVLIEIFPDISNRLNSIEQNIRSDNPEDWKNAVTSCRTLFMDIADILNPAECPKDKDKYINRLKDFISPRVEGKTKKELYKSYLEEMKKRLEYTSDLTQGGVHKDRPALDKAENVVLYTYLIISDLMEIYSRKQVMDNKKCLSVS